MSWVNITYYGKRVGKAKASKPTDGFIETLHQLALSIWEDPQAKRVVTTMAGRYKKALRSPAARDDVSWFRKEIRDAFEEMDQWTDPQVLDAMGGTMERFRKLGNDRGGFTLTFPRRGKFPLPLEIDDYAGIRRLNAMADSLTAVHRKLVHIVVAGKAHGKFPEVEATCTEMGRWRLMLDCFKGRFNYRLVREPGFFGGEEARFVVGFIEDYLAIGCDTDQDHAIRMAARCTVKMMGGFIGFAKAAVKELVILVGIKLREEAASG